MEKVLPDPGRTSLIFPVPKPTSLIRINLCIIYHVVFIILTPACLPLLTNAQQRIDKNPERVDTLSVGDFSEEENIERDIGTNRSGSDKKDAAVDDAAVRSRQKEILKTVMGFMGIQYRRFGADSNGFDCSGFIVRIFQEACGILIPHSSRAQYSRGKNIMRDDLRFGDLVFFSLRGEYPSHVGIYIGDGLFAHASIKRGVTVSLINSEYYVKRYFGACRILE